MILNVLQRQRGPFQGGLSGASKVTEDFERLVRWKRLPSS